MTTLPDAKSVDPRNRGWWLPLLAGIVLAVPQAQSQTVAWGTSVSFNPLSFTSNGAVDDGKLIWQMGWFTTGFVPTASNWAQWRPNWHQVDSDLHQYWDGLWAVSVNTENVGTAAGKPIYVFAFNNLELLGTPAGEALLYRQDGLLFPSIPNQVTFDTADNPLDDTELVNDNAFTVIWGRVDRRMYDSGGILTGGGVFGSLVADSIAQPADQLNGTFEVQSGTWPGTGLTPYQTWIAVYFPGVTNPAIVGEGADPDRDGQANFFEFALGGNPANSAGNARIYSLIADSDDPDTAKELLLTIAVRAGTPVFTGTPSPTAAKDGFGYTVQGSLNLADFSSSVLPVAPVVTGLPTVPSGYEYRSFSLAQSANLPAKGFLRVRIAAAP